MDLIPTAWDALKSVSEPLQVHWSQLPEVSRSVIGAAIGVFFGAWVASRAQTKKAIVSELHALKAAHALAFSIANKALALKKQHIRPLEESYKAALASHKAFTINPRFGLSVQIDLRSLSQVNFPDRALEKIILDRCFLGGEAIATLVAVVDATDDLKTSITLRNELADEFRKNPPADKKQQIERYLGLKAGSEQDQRICDNTFALLAQTNDCIFFVNRLSEHIRKAENRLRRRNGWKYRLPGRKLKPVNWKRAEGLLPAEADYENWTSGFVNEPSLIKRGLGFLQRTKVGT